MIDSSDLATISKLAHMGQVDMQLLLGKIYLEGECGLQSDNEKAAEWFKKAADQNNSEAQLLLGAIYVQENKLEEGMKLVTLSAMGGCEDALKIMHDWADSGFSAVQYVLGCIYLYGKGVEVDQTEARRLFRKARALGDIDATFMLGIISANDEDYQTALEYISEAAQKGQKDAIELLSSIQRETSSSSSGGLINYAGQAVYNAAKNRVANKALDMLWSWLTR